MGGLGSGGARTVGAGVKPALGPLPPVEPFEPSEALTDAERLAWDRLAPHAFRRRTLTKSTEYQFVLLCRNVVMEAEMAADPEQRGAGNHRGLIQRIDAQLLRFDLAPNGKPHGDVLDAPVKEKSRLELLSDKRRALAG